MCWVIKIGARSIAAPSCPIKVVSACGPPVEEPISNTRGRQRANGRRLNAGASACSGALSRSRGAGSGRLAIAPALPWRANAAAAKIADFLDQLVLERRQHAGIGRGPRFRNIVGGAERQRPQAHLRAPPRQRRGHDHHQIGLLLQQQRQRRNAVKLRHVDVEDDDVRIILFDLIDRLASGAQAGDDGHIRLGVDPARRQAARDNRIVDDHHADAPVEGGRRADLGGAGDTHGTGIFDTQLGTRTFSNATRGRRWLLRSVRLPGTWPRRCPGRTAS